MTTVRRLEAITATIREGAQVLRFKFEGEREGDCVELIFPAGSDSLFVETMLTAATHQIAQGDRV